MTIATSQPLRMKVLCNASRVVRSSSITTSRLLAIIGIPLERRAAERERPSFPSIGACGRLRAHLPRTRLAFLWPVTVGSNGLQERRSQSRGTARLVGEDARLRYLERNADRENVQEQINEEML